MDYLPSLFLHHYALLVCALHILLQDCLSTAQIDAAEAMLFDFVALLPELYGGKSCTANSHLLTHLPKYVRFWGPLWTHSAFGFESKNGHLKHLFHSRFNIVDQLCFNIDIQQTIQLLHPTLQLKESVEVLDFLRAMSGSTPRRAMQEVEAHTYILGSVRQKQLSAEERELFGTTLGQVQTFSRAFHHGTLYHCATYFKSEGKRNNQVCHFKSERGCSFGQIQLFALTPDPMAIMKVFEHSDSTFLQRAGHPCRQTLAEYRDIDFLSAFVHEIRCPEAHSHLEAIPLCNITGKAIYIHMENSVFHYVLKQPNTYEHN